MDKYPALTRAVLERTLAELEESRELTSLIGRHSIKARITG